MRFDPKLNSADAASSDGPLDSHDDLPEDLALLGRALSLDAARLAGRYPAEHGLGAPAASSRQGWLAKVLKTTVQKTATINTAATRTAAAVALVAASVALATYMGGLVVWRYGAPLADQGPARGIVYDASDAATALQFVPAARTDDLLPLRGAFFRELSGPQQEAVLDLLEENALAQGSVSI